MKQTPQSAKKTAPGSKKKLIFTIVAMIAAAVLLIALISIPLLLIMGVSLPPLLVNPVRNLTYKHTVAVQVGEHKISSVELNYFYVDAVNNFYNQYKSYISYLGFSTTTPLDEQTCAFDNTKTWADYFIDQAHQNIKSTYAVYDRAMEAGFTLSDAYRNSLEANLKYIEQYANLYGYKSTNSYLISIYGNGSTEKSYREYLEKCTIAEAYYTFYADSLVFSEEDQFAYNQLHERELNSYSYAYCYLSVQYFYPKDAGIKDEKGNLIYSDAETADAISAARAAAEALHSGIYPDLEDFELAISQLSTDQDPDFQFTCVANDDVSYANLNTLFAGWLAGQTGVDENGTAKYGDLPQPGQTKIFAHISGTDQDQKVLGYYVIRYQGHNDNRVHLVNVRHILVMFRDAGGNTYSEGVTNFTETQKKIAKMEIQEILAEFISGDMTEEAFAKLAREATHDAGSRFNGGLYEKVYPGQMVTNFNDWCMDETRRSGDFDLIETEFGYHLMYFVSRCDINYRDYLIIENLRVETTNSWHSDLLENTSLTVITTKHVNKQLTLG